MYSDTDKKTGRSWMEYITKFRNKLRKKTVSIFLVFADQNTCHIRQSSLVFQIGMLRQFFLYDSACNFVYPFRLKCTQSYPRLYHNSDATVTFTSPFCTILQNCLLSSKRIIYFISVIFLLSYNTLICDM